MLMQQIPVQNRLLATLCARENFALPAQFEPIQLHFGEILFEPGDVIRHLYFPNNALVSLLTSVGDHSALEVGMVGKEGMVGISLVLGAKHSSILALVQGSGSAYRIDKASFQAEFSKSAAFEQAIYAYTNHLMGQISLTAACNRFHRIEKRLARWLLMTRDRVGSDHFHMTHEFLGNMLGVQRAGVTIAAVSLKRLSLIEYSRGNITILDGAALERQACSCYVADKAFG